MENQHICGSTNKETGKLFYENRKDIKLHNLFDSPNQMREIGPRLSLSTYWMLCFGNSRMMPAWSSSRWRPAFCFSFSSVIAVNRQWHLTPAVLHCHCTWVNVMTPVTQTWLCSCRIKILFLVVSSTHQCSINWLVCIHIVVTQWYNPMISH